jgi:hypothetical protein
MSGRDKRGWRFGRQATRWLALAAVVVLTSACSSPNAAQVGGSGWEVQRYLAFNSVWASITELLVVENLPDSTWRGLVTNGYVTTDADGQGRIRRDQCTAWVFQKSSWGFSREEVSACARGSTSVQCSTASTALFQNCAISVVTLPATVTMQGTVVTVVYNQEAELTLAIVHEGGVLMTPADAPDDAVFEVPAGAAGLVVRNEFRRIGFEEAAQIIAELGQMDQMQRANLLVREQGLPMVPFDQPFALGLRGLPDDALDPRVSEALFYGANWPVLMREIFPNQDVPIYLMTAGRGRDLRDAPYAPERSRELLAEAGYPNGIELVLWYDSSIEELPPLTDFLAGMLGEAGIFVEIRSVAPDDAPEVLADASAGREPALLIGAR